MQQKKTKSFFIYVEVDDIDKDDFVAGKEAEGDAIDVDETQDE